MGQAPVGDRPGYRVKQVQQALRHAGDAALRGIGLSVSQYAALRALADRPGASSAEVARRCFVTRQSVADVLGPLRAAGAVEDGEPARGRARPMALTTVGRARLAAAETAMAEVEERMLAGLSAREVATLTELLTVCAANLGDLSATTGPPAP
ncbi:MarR family winged helix-turn-helix transcriptional regulator [Actinomycetospora sp. C-140]